MLLEGGTTAVELCGPFATLHGFPSCMASQSGGTFQAVRTRFHSAAASSTVDASAVKLARNSFPEQHINVRMFSDGQSSHTYILQFLFLVSGRLGCSFHTRRLWEQVVRLPNLPALDSFRSCHSQRTNENCSSRLRHSTPHPIKTTRQHRQKQRAQRYRNESQSRNSEVDA